MSASEFPVFKATSPFQTFESFLGLAGLLGDELEITVDEKGWHMRKMDGPRVCMVNADLQATGIEEYSVQKPGRIAFSLGDLNHALKGLRKTDKATLETREGDNKVKVTTHGAYVYEASLNTIEVEEASDLPTPKLAFSIKATLITKPIQEALDKTRKFTDHFYIEISGDQVVFTGKGDLADGRATVKRGSEALLSIEAQKTVKSGYSLDYLLEFFKALRDAETIQICMTDSDSMPLKIIPKFLVDSLQAEYYVAPRIDVE